MLKNITLLSLLLFCLLPPVVSAEPRGYQVLPSVQPTQNQDKIEVIEFFWYGCPHCYRLEPELNVWLKTLPANVEFIRQPTTFNRLWEHHAKAYFVAEYLNLTDKVHADLFDAIQNKKQKMTRKNQLAMFFIARGVDEAQFNQAFDSFFVATKLRQAKDMTERYGIAGVPAFVVNGKYKTSGVIAGSHQKMIAVLNQLIKQETQMQ